MVVIGIDPGISGALALVDHHGLRHVADMPVMPRSAGGAFVDVIGGHTLGTSEEPLFLVGFLPGTEIPGGWRAFKSAGVGGDVLGHDGAREPLEAEEAFVAVLVVGTP